MHENVRREKNDAKKDSKIEEKRDFMIEDLVNHGVYKADGKQLYELNLYELTKKYIVENEQKSAF